MESVVTDSAIKLGDPKVIRGWVMYDWANSVYQLTIASAIFPVYYSAVTSAGGSDVVDFFGFKVINTVLYSWGIAAAYLLLALLTPMWSSIADYTGRRKAFMQVFTLLGGISCGTLYFFNKANIELGIISFFFAWVGYGGSLVFYNSFLPLIAAPEDQDRISARGFSMGYIGGVVLLIVNPVFVLKPGLVGLTVTAFPARLAFLTVCVWWIGFAQITFAVLPKYTFGKPSKGNVFLKGYQEFRTVWNYVKHSRSMTLYLVAYFFMTSGILTVMFMAATYGEKELGLGYAGLIGNILL